MNKINLAKTAKISVIVPVYNSTKTLRHCAEALKNQTDANYEIIFVDDCSTDSSYEICEQMGARAIRLPVNKGQAVARNAGVKESRGEIIAFADSDVVVPAHWLEKYRHLLALHSEADMICSGYSDSREGTLPAMFAFYESIYRRSKLPRYIRASTSSNCIIYKDVFYEVGGYPEYYVTSHTNIPRQKAVSVNEDADLGFLIGRKGYKIVWSNDNPVGHYFRNSWGGYIKQQIQFSRYAVLSIFKFPGMLFIKNIYSNEKIAAQLAIMAFMILAFSGFLFGTTGLLLFLIMEGAALTFFYFLQKKFLKFLKENMKDYSYPALFSIILLSRFYWLYGIALGLADGCYMSWNNYLHKIKK